MHLNPQTGLHDKELSPEQKKHQQQNQKSQETATVLDKKLNGPNRPST